MRFLLLLFLALALPAVSEPKASFTGFVRAEGRGWAALRTQTEYDDFVARIPTHKVQMRQPAPLSTDPLLQHPAFDFEHEALIVAWSNNIHVVVSIDATRKIGDDLEIDLGFGNPPNLEGRAAPHNIGHYHLIKVETFKGELKRAAVRMKPSN